MIRNMSRAALVAAAVITAGTAFVNCSKRTSNDDIGSLQLALTLSPGVIINTVTYTISGNGITPINGTIDVFNQCFGPGDCTALVNFWRSLANLTINVNVGGKTGCPAAGEFWAVSQAAPMRRVHVNGFATLMWSCVALLVAGGALLVAGGAVSAASPSPPKVVRPTPALELGPGGARLRVAF